MHDKTEFVYILEWPDIETMKKQWDVFMSNEEWAEIKNQTRQQYGEMVIGKVKDQVLTTTGWFENNF